MKFKLQNVYAECAFRVLNCSNSPGPDKIPGKILKDAVNLVSKLLKMIYNA